jgi:hypothetical protein
MLETVKEEHPAAVKHALDQIAPVWMGAFKALLAGDAAGEVQANWENLGIRIEIFRVGRALHFNTFSSLQSSLLPGRPFFRPETEPLMTTDVTVVVSGNYS